MRDDDIDLSRGGRFGIPDFACEACLFFVGEGGLDHHRPEAPPPPKDPPPPEKPPPPKPPPPEKPPPPHRPPMGMIHGMAAPRPPRLRERNAKNSHRPKMMATQ